MPCLLQNSSLLSPQKRKSTVPDMVLTSIVSFATTVASTKHTEFSGFARGRALPRSIKCTVTFPGWEIWCVPNYICWVTEINTRASCDQLSWCVAYSVTGLLGQQRTSYPDEYYLSSQFGEFCRGAPLPCGQITRAQFCWRTVSTDWLPELFWSRNETGSEKFKRLCDKIENLLELCADHQVKIIFFSWKQSIQKIFGYSVDLRGAQCWQSKAGRT